jgi:hypothetical protein
MEGLIQHQGIDSVFEQPNPYGVVMTGVGDV